MRVLQTAKEGKALRALLRGQVERLRELAARDVGLDKERASPRSSHLPLDDAAGALPAQPGASRAAESLQPVAAASAPLRIGTHSSEAGEPALAGVEVRVSSGGRAQELAGQPAEAPAGRGELDGPGLRGMPGSGSTTAAGLPRVHSAEMLASTKIEDQVRSMYCSWKQRRRVTRRPEGTLQSLRLLDDLQQRMLELRTSLHECQLALASAQACQDTTDGTSDASNGSAGGRTDAPVDCPASSRPVPS